MKYLKVGVGAFFVMIGVLLFVFLRMLNDPEVEGNSGRIKLSEYLISFLPFAIGLIIIFLKINKKSI